MANRIENRVVGLSEDLTSELEDVSFYGEADPNSWNRSGFLGEPAAKRHCIGGGDENSSDDDEDGLEASQCSSSDDIDAEVETTHIQEVCDCNKVNHFEAVNLETVLDIHSAVGSMSKAAKKQYLLGK